MNYNCVAVKLNKITGLIDKFYVKKIKELNLPILMNHIPLFYILSASTKPLAFTEIFNQWEISKSSLSEVINKYHKMGLVEKISSAEDKRSFSIALTEEGKKVTDTLSDLEDEILTKFYSSFDGEKSKEFDKDVEQVLDNLKDI